MNNAKEILASICEAIERKKGEKVSILDVRKVSSFTDFFIICQGGNRRQNQAICDEIVEGLKSKEQMSPLHVEGYEHAEWILLDYVDMIVHVFSEDARQFYKLEKLWSDGVQVKPRARSA